MTSQVLRSRTLLKVAAARAFSVRPCVLLCKIDWQRACTICCMAPVARHYEDLIFWQLATQLKVRLYAIVDRPSVRRDFEFVQQLRDSAASGPSNIAEGFGRRSNAEFLHYLSIARGSLNEVQNHLKDGVHRGHIQDREFRELLVLNRRALGALARFQRYLRRNPRPPDRDPEDEG